MEQADIRKQLHQYVDTGDEKLLNLLFTVAKDYDTDDSGYEFTQEEIAIFEDRRKKAVSGESKLYSWADAKKMIAANIANRKRNEL